MNETIYKYLTIIIGGLLAVIEKAMQFFIPCIITVVLDIIAAYSLGRRVHKKYPQKADGKFKSEFKNRVLVTLAILFLVIILSSYVDILIFRNPESDIALRFSMGCFLFYEAWSILENVSSCNGKKWAKVLQKIMVDKAERHFNIDLKELKKEKE